jgi:hypothetical protein
MDRRIIDYKLVYGTPNGIEEKVKHLMKDEWQPSGDLLQFVPDRGANTYFVQKMLKYEEF